MAARRTAPGQLAVARLARRTRVVDELLAAGWDVPDTQANFVWLALGGDTAAFAEAVHAEGVSIRPFPGDGPQWPTTVRLAGASARSTADTIALQEEVRGLVDRTDTGRFLQHVAGLDVARDDDLLLASSVRGLAGSGVCQRRNRRRRSRARAAPMR